MRIDLLTCTLGLIIGAAGYRGDYPNGSCRSTDLEFAEKCNAAVGICHSWNDQYPVPNSLSYRASWMNNMVFLHKQDLGRYDVGKEAGLSAESDVSFIKDMYFTTPGLLGFTGCGEEDLHRRISNAWDQDETSVKNLKLMMQHVAVHTGDLGAGIVDETRVKTLMPRNLYRENITMLSMGSDSQGQRDLIGTKSTLHDTDSGTAASVDSFFMYQIFVKPQNLEWINPFGDPFRNEVKELKIMPYIDVAAGDFKFTYGLIIRYADFPMVFNVSNNLNVIRVTLDVKGLKMDTATDDSIHLTYHALSVDDPAADWSTSDDANTGVLYKSNKKGSPKVASVLANFGLDGIVNGTFSLSFSDSFQWGAFDRSAQTNGYTSRRSFADVSAIHRTETDIQVYVDCWITDDMRAHVDAQISNGKGDDSFLIMYDPELEVEEEKYDLSVSGAAGAKKAWAWMLLLGLVHAMG